MANGLLSAQTTGIVTPQTRMIACPVAGFLTFQRRSPTLGVFFEITDQVAPPLREIRTAILLASAVLQRMDCLLPTRQAAPLAGDRIEIGEGFAYIAVTVLSLLIDKTQVAPETLSQPVQLMKFLSPAVGGATKVTEAFLLKKACKSRGTIALTVAIVWGDCDVQSGPGVRIHRQCRPYFINCKDSAALTPQDCAAERVA